MICLCGCDTSEYTAAETVMMKDEILRKFLFVAWILLFVTRGYGQSEEIKAHRLARKKAASRQRRIILNNDGGRVKHGCKEVTVEELLKGWNKLVNSQVDTISYCTNAGFGQFTHNTKVGQVFTTTTGRFRNNKVAEFIAKGIDPLEAVVEFCKSHDIEIFWSLRMNDTHDAAEDEGSRQMFSRVKREHPEWLMGSRENRPRYCKWTAVDYGREEIRELVFKYVEEVCTNYDIDGVQLDFFRHLGNFKRVVNGHDATQVERDMMTDLIRRIRKMTERVGLERGRAILVGVRVPDSAAYCEAIGLDIVRWMEDELIDILIPSGYFRLNPWEYSIELGHRYGVQVYPCLSESRLLDEKDGGLRKTVECYRGRAVNVWHSGADGIYFFNYFKPKSPLWQEVGELETLTWLDKVYTTGARSPKAMGFWLRGGNRFLNRRPLSYEHPLFLRAGVSRTVEIRIGEDLREAAARGHSAKVKLELAVRELKQEKELKVKLNGVKLEGASRSGDSVEYALACNLLKQGKNDFEIGLGPESKAKAIVDDLLVWVRYQ